jgi:hypothetical protein
MSIWHLRSVVRRVAISILANFGLPVWIRWISDLWIEWINEWRMKSFAIFFFFYSSALSNAKSSVLTINGRNEAEK